MAEYSPDRFLDRVMSNRFTSPIKWQFDFGAEDWMNEYRDVINENPGADQERCMSLMFERADMLKQRGRPDSIQVTHVYTLGVDACTRASEVYPVPNSVEAVDALKVQYRKAIKIPFQKPKAEEGE